jgi:predicted SAM-dependent methyltransferase
MKKINLGSGFIGLPGWINYDNSIVAKLARWKWVTKVLVSCRLLPKGYLDIRWPPIVVHDCRKGIPLADNSVDIIYSSHFFEHLYRSEVFCLLKECRRVLKPNGVMRVVLPDTEKIANMFLGVDQTPFPYEKEYCTNKTDRANAFASNFYGSAYHNNLNGVGMVQRLQEMFLSHHKWAYTYESFKALMEQAGFSHICRKAYRVSSIPEAQSLDVLPEVSFYLETGQAEQQQ